MDANHYPHPSRRRVVLARNGVVATSQPLAAEAGLFVLRSGGNAIDAAIATAATLTVVEPTSNGLGGDAFALLWHEGELYGLNGSGAWPARSSAEQLRAQGHRQVPECGWPAVTVPGAPATWRDLHERFGRLPLANVLAPALDYAERGFVVSPVVAHYWARAARRLAASGDPSLAGWSATFTREGRVPAAGDVFSCPGHAATLRRFVDHGISDFYEGQIAETLGRFAEATGGALRASDLRRHQSEWVEPLRTAYRGHEIWQLPPNGPGIATLLALGILEGFDLAGLGHGSSHAWHLQIESLKLALADTRDRLADPRHLSEPLERCLSSDSLERRRAQLGERAGHPGPGAFQQGGTVYLCTADADGSMVSFIQSNYMGFGSGVVEPRFGIALHNRGACFTLEPGHDNEAAPGKRPRHTLMPGFVTRDGAAVGPFGVMGGEMQPQGQLQVISSVLDHGLNPQAALDAPRFRVMDGGKVLVEAPAHDSVVRELRDRGHEVEVTPDAGYFGRGQMIWRLESGSFAAGTEPRADGGIAAW